MLQHAGRQGGTQQAGRQEGQHETCWEAVRWVEMLLAEDNGY